jgi:uncharacterized membrane protein ArfC
MNRYTVIEDVNWWLLALAFVLGLLLTLASMIRRVTREAPITEPFGVIGPGLRGAAEEAGAEGGGSARSFTDSTVGGEDVPTGTMPSAGGVAAGAASGVAAAKFGGRKSGSESATAKVAAVGEDYGAGSARGCWWQRSVGVDD